MAFYWALMFMLIPHLNQALPGRHRVPPDLELRVRRQAVATDAGLWPAGEVVYTFSNSLMKDVRAIRAINASIDHWENVTCLTFTYRPLHQLKHTDKYIVFRGGFKCASPVGMSPGVGPQVIDVSRSCAYTAMMVHELGHAVGLWHEHSRRDRDAHVLVMWKNMKDGEKHNFDIRPDARLLTPYDLYSVMHYEPMMFSKNAKPTLRTIDPRLQHLIGWHSSLSHYDVMSISNLYQCEALCPQHFRCENDGFKMASTCTCRCPHGLTGQRCHLVDTDEDCGGVIHVEDTMSLSVEGRRSTIPTSRSCVWLLKGAAGTQVTLTFNSTNLYKDIYDTCLDELEVRYHSIGVPEGYRLCKSSKNRKSLKFRSVDNKIMLHFDTEGTNPEAGFTATVSVRPQKDCRSSPCLNGGVCEDVHAIDTYVCTCPPNWIGKDCDIPIVDGGWSAWTAWSPCVAECGHSSRTRTCNNPRPVNGGRSCKGPTAQTQKCTTLRCLGLFSCDFGTKNFPDDCGLVPGDSPSYPLQWEMNAGKTPSSKTGPDGGHTTGGRSDMYLYLEASTGQKYQKAVMWYKVQEAQGQYCLEFFYSLYGAHIGPMSVVKQGHNDEQPVTLWQRSGDKGRGWRAARVSINLMTGEKLGFMATRGTTYQGDIGLDDISLSPGSCKELEGIYVYRKGCQYKGKKVPTGTFTYKEGCEERTCFCNQDGVADCPTGPITDTCGSYDYFYDMDINHVGF